MLHQRPRPGLELLKPQRQILHPALRHRFELAAPSCHAPFHAAVPGDDLLPFLHPDVARVGMHHSFFPVQQRVRLTDVRHVGRRARHAMHQPRGGVGSDVRLHSEVPLVAYFCLVHLGISLCALVFG